jgi:hypothetical protein
MVSIRCSPPESVPATWERRSASRGKSSKAASRPSRTPLRPRMRWIESARFSSTLSVAKTDRPSGAWATPARANAWVGFRVTSSPSRSTAPLVGAMRPEATRAMVVFPAPLGPTMATASPGATVIDTPKSARKTP